MNKNFETVLPDDYKEVKVLDAKSVGFAIFMNVMALVIMIALIYIGVLIFLPKINEITMGLYWTIMASLFGFIVIIICHELTHGLFYKIFTKQKLTFGLTLTVAYCGVPNIYVYRKPMMITAMAPCIIFTTIFVLLILIIPNVYIQVAIYFAGALHFGGCFGDIWSTILLLFKYRSNDVLINDTGPKQTFYCRIKK